MKGINTLDELLATMPNNKTIIDNAIICWSKINSPKYQKPLCTVSGGADSTIMLDLVHRCDPNNKVTYCWFDTGLEMAVIKEQLEYLSTRYGITIRREKAIKPIPLSVRTEGNNPFLNKRTSNYLHRLQLKQFSYEDAPIEELLEKYCTKATPEQKEKFDSDFELFGVTPKNWALRNGEWYSGCVSALEWWCNCSINGGENSQCNISHNKHLKEFLIATKPTKEEFPVSDNCCKWAKKEVAHNLIRNEGFDLNLIGLRKKEGGVRQQLTSCFSEDKDGKCDVYRPVFWYSNEDKLEYERHFNIIQSKAYTEYHFPRTGCAGCSFGLNWENEVSTLEKHEPQLAKAVKTTFAKSYEWQRAYKEFCKEQEKQLFYDKYGFTERSLFEFIPEEREVS